MNVADSAIANKLALYADSLSIWHNEYLSHKKVNLDNYTLETLTSDFLDLLYSISQRYFQTLGVSMNETFEETAMENWNYESFISDLEY